MPDGSNMPEAVRYGAKCQLGQQTLANSFFFNIPVSPVEHLRSILDKDESDLQSLSATEILAKHISLRNAARALLVYTTDVEQKLAKAQLEIKELTKSLQTPIPTSTVTSTAAYSIQATPDLFSISKRNVDAAHSAGRTYRPPLRSHNNLDSKSEQRQIVHHLPYTTLEEIRENVSSRSTSLSSATSRRSSITPGESRRSLSKKRASSASAHASMSSVAGIPSIASVTKGPYPAHASVITNLYRYKLRKPRIKNSNTGTKQQKRDTTARSTSLPASVSVVSVKRRAHHPKKEAFLESIFWSISTENAQMRSELADLHQKFDKVASQLQRVTRLSENRQESLAPVESSQLSSKPSGHMLEEKKLISPRQVNDISVITALDAENELHNYDTTSIDYSTINPAVVTAPRLANITNRSFSTTCIGSSQQSLVIPPRHVVSRSEKASSLTNSFQDLAADVIQELHSGQENSQSQLHVSDIQGGNQNAQQGYLQQIYHTTQQLSLQRKNDKLRETNRQLHGTLLELKKTFNEGNLASLAKDNEALLARVSELEQTVFILEASAARSQQLTATKPKPEVSEFAAQTEFFTMYLDKNLETNSAVCSAQTVQTDMEVSPALLTAETQSLLTFRELDLVTDKLRITEICLKHAESELAREREKAIAFPPQILQSKLDRSTSPLASPLKSMASIGVQTVQPPQISDPRTDSLLNLTAENTSLLERIQLLTEELSTSSLDKKDLSRRLDELQKQYNTLYDYSQAQQDTYSKLSEAQLSSINMQQQILLLEEKQRDQEEQIRKAHELKEAHLSLTQEVWKLSAQNEKLLAHNNNLIDELQTLKKRTSEALKEHLRTTIDLEKHKLLEEEACALKKSLQELKETSDKQFNTLYAEKKELESKLAQMQTANTNAENALLSDALELQRQIQTLKLENTNQLTELQKQKARAHLAEERLGKALEKLQLASKEIDGLRSINFNLQSQRAEQEVVIGTQQQELQSVQLALQDESLGLQTRIKELDNENKRLNAIIQSLQIAAASTGHSSQSSSFNFSDIATPEKQPTVPRVPLSGGGAPKQANDTHVKLILENAHLRQELSKQEKQVRSLQSQNEKLSGENSVQELEYLRKVVEDIHPPPEYRESLGLYIRHLEDTCSDLQTKIVELHKLCATTEQKYESVCSQLNQLLEHPNLRVILRDINGTLLNCAEQHREINDAYNTVLVELMNTIEMLSAQDQRAFSDVSIHDYVSMKGTLEVLKATLRAKELEIHKLNRVVSDLKRANIEILMLAPQDS